MAYIWEYPPPGWRVKDARFSAGIVSSVSQHSPTTTDRPSEALRRCINVTEWPASNVYCYYTARSDRILTIYTSFVHQHSSSPPFLAIAALGGMGNEPTLQSTLPRLSRFT